MYSPTVYLSLVVLLHIPNVASAADVNAKVGERILIPCKITGTYVLPEWLKDTTISIANQGGSSINPAYSARFSYDSDQRTLIVDPVQLNDTGSYECTHPGGDNSPQTTTVEITASTTTTPRSPEEKGLTKTTMIIVIVCSCGVTAIVVFIVLLVIRRWKHLKEKKSPNEMVDSKGQNVNSRNEFSDIIMGDSQ